MRFPEHLLGSLHPDKEDPRSTFLHFREGYYEALRDVRHLLRQHEAWCATQCGEDGCGCGSDCTCGVGDEA